MIQTLGQWVHDHPDLLLGLVLIALAFAIVLAAGIGEAARKIGQAPAATRRTRAEPPVDEWAAELEDRR